MNKDDASLKGSKLSTRDASECHNTVRCDVCLTEVPLSVAKSVEGLDYVHYFCGLNCMDKWRTQPQTKAKVLPDNK